jgi:large subunit ribosomal protein L23
MQDQQNQYVFAVDMNANKHEISDAVEKLFSVSVKNVRTQNQMGKVRKMGRFGHQEIQASNAKLTVPNRARDLGADEEEARALVARSEEQKRGA